jgi:hypothetical protein
VKTFAVTMYVQVANLVTQDLVFPLYSWMGLRFWKQISIESWAGRADVDRMPRHVRGREEVTLNQTPLQRLRGLKAEVLFETRESLSHAAYCVLAPSLPRE